MTQGIVYDKISWAFWDVERKSISKSRFARQTESKSWWDVNLFNSWLGNRKSTRFVCDSKIKILKKRRHFCWNSILVDMCSDYNILVESWFFFVSEKHVSTFWIFFHLLFYYSQLDIWISNWWAVGYSYIQQLLIE